MSIRLLAKDLYQSQQKVRQLEDALAAAPFDKRKSIEDALRKARVEKDRLKKALDGRIGR